MFVRRSFALSCCISMSVFALSCSKGDRPDLAIVEGRVTLDGQPVDEAVVVFSPVGGGGRQSMGITDEKGLYRLNYIRDIEGAKVGMHTICVANTTEDSPNTLPPRYARHDTTDLKREVVAGGNRIDLDLISD